MRITTSIFAGAAVCIGLFFSAAPGCKKEKEEERITVNDTVKAPVQDSFFRQARFAGTIRIFDSDYSGNEDSLTLPDTATLKIYRVPVAGRTVVTNAQRQVVRLFYQHDHSLKINPTLIVDTASYSGRYYYIPYTSSSDVIHITADSFTFHRIIHKGEGGLATLDFSGKQLP